MTPQEWLRGPGPRPGSGTRRPSDERKPTVRQVYAIARALCRQADIRWPATRRAASELIELLRAENELEPEPPT